jgi:MoaA/NifB/PqqE/SkfB family radical SAM enzyme
MNRQRTVYFDFFYFCNLGCRHCITNSSSKADRKNELKPERVMSVMYELATVGVLELGIGGGDPFCHSDIFLFLEDAVDLHLNVVLTTNGILITPKRAKRLKKISVSEFRVSFDGSESS